MKLYLYIGGFILLSWFSLLSASRVFADEHTMEMDALIRDQMNSVVEAEYRSTQSQLQADLNKTRARIKMLEGQKSDAFQRASDKSATAQAGQVQFKQFHTLIKNRYVNKKAIFEPAMEISTRDVENLNDLFKSYLSTTMFHGRVSAGQAVKKLEYGMEKLDEVVQNNSKPAESNNSELEIIGFQIREEEAKVEKLQSLATALGLTLDLNAPVAATPRVAVSDALPVKRAPASVKKVQSSPSKFKSGVKSKGSNK